MPYAGLLIIVIVMLLASAIRVLREYERGVIFRFGPADGFKGTGVDSPYPID